VRGLRERPQGPSLRSLSRTARAVTACAALLALAACGGEDAPERPQVTKAQYVSRIDAICRSYETQSAPLERQLSSATQTYGAAGPEVLFAQISPPLARLATLVEEAYGQMRRVPPATDAAAADARAWLAAVKENVDATKRLQEVVRRRDVAGFRRFVEETGPTIETRLDARARTLGLKECGDDDAQGTPPGGEATPAPTPAPGGGQEGPRALRAGLREPLRVTSEEGDVVMQVLRVRSRVRTSPYSRPERGTRLYGVDLEIRNVGQKVFSPPFSAVVKMVDSEGGTGDYATVVGGGKCGRGFALDVNVTPGNREQGCIPFALDRGTRPARLQIQLGYGDDQVVAEFDLTGGGGSGGAPAPDATPAPEETPTPAPTPPPGESPGTPS